MKFENKVYIINKVHDSDVGIRIISLDSRRSEECIDFTIMGVFILFIFSRRHFFLVEKCSDLKFQGRFVVIN